MKKLFFLPLLLAAGYTQAQITLDQTDFASVGDTVFLATDITIPGTNLGSPSASAQTWNFTNFGIDGFDTLLFVSPASTGLDAEFPTANIALLTGQTTTFFNKTSGSVKILGNGGAAQGFGFTALYNPPYDILTFPTTNTTTISAISGFDAIEFIGIDTTVPLIGQIKVDSVRFKRELESEITFDAFGNVTLPVGTFNSLRAYNEQTTNDSLYINMGAPVPFLSLTQGWNTVTPALLAQINGLAPGLFTGQTIGFTTTRSYDWYAKSVGYRLASIEVNQSGQPTRAQYLSNPSLLSIGTEELLPTAFIYPNPTAEFIALSGVSNDTQGNITVLDLNGKAVLNAIYNGQYQISVAGLASGTYFFRFTNKQGKLVFADKFQIVK
jgi:hypothetical protein